ncbi:hypothetical protein [Streptomyces sp. 891-h]|uniref:hypothetical protein n=1 Tax=Streptomyces sp. 891-h TaxID=2720714 RepID=UPI001FAAA8E3|nr:hypothetical protein [Streptomyces sp. 891-h]UNZ21162.1 hypothetical protein HC362_32890 [Streptomyces sp. 891-h]
MEDTMGVVQDRALSQLADTRALAELLAPRAQLLLRQSYELEHERIDSVKDLRVTSIRLAQPLRRPRRRHGSWTQVLPAPTRSDFAWEVDASDPEWIDVLAELEIDVVAETDPGGLESLVVRALGAFSTLDEFRAQFRFLDLDAFMATHGLTTVEDLREAGDYLRMEARLRRPPDFDPAHPANSHTVPVTAAVLVGDLADVSGVLRAARRIGEASRDRPLPPGGFAVRRAAHALVAAFPKPGTPDPQALPQAQIDALLTGAGIAALFLT